MTGLATDHTEALRALASPTGIADPYPAYAALRESSPVHGLVDYPVGSIPGQDEPVTAWAVLSHEQVVEVLKNPAVYSSRDPAHEAAGEPSAIFGRNDPPLHTAERKVANQAFTRPRVSALRPWLEEYIGGLVEQLPEDEDVDVMKAIAYVVPSTVMTQFFGAPVTDAPRYRGWAQAFMLSAEMTPDERMASHIEMATYFGELVGARMEDPRGDDFVDGLVRATDGNGDKLDVWGVVRYCVTVLAGGAETSMYLIGNLLHGLAERPEIAARVRADRALIDPFVQETIRLTGPAQRLFRVANTDTTLGGKRIAKDERVAVFFAAASTDPAVFEDPLEFRLDRPNANKHLSFGLGAHFCLGAPLALLTADVLINAVFDRFDRVEHGAVAPRSQDATLLIHGFSELPLRFIPGDNA
ncbi:MAG TPA: cytochrome P450 [Solirubrobacteraceae bacterium]